MVYTIAILSLAVLVFLVAFFWKREGPGSGRGYGNRVAAHVEIPRNVFYQLLDNGVKGSSREVLASMEKANLSLEEAGVRLAPSLALGIERLEARFGSQGTIEAVKPTVARLVAAGAQQPESGGGDSGA